METVLIVGGTGGIGGALARKLVAEGKRVVAMARSEDRLNAMAQDLGEAYVPHVGDALDRSSLEAAVGLAGESLRGLAYCVGTINLKTLAASTRQDWIDAFEKNVLGAAEAIGLAWPALRQAKAGSIVLFSTTAAQIGLPNHAVVAAAKGAVEGLMLSLAAEGAPFNIRANAIAPGLTDTPLASFLTRSPAALETSVKMHPLGRIAQPEEVASLAAYLLSDAGSFVTGQVIAIDGGLSSVRPRTS